MASKFSIHRPISSYEKIRKLFGFVQRRRKSQFGRREITRKSYLDLGCGPNPHNDFINLDYRWAPHIDISWDVTKGLPFPSNSLVGIFSEHCFEHLSLTAMPGLLRECHRILKPGATIRIVVPDAELYLRRYVSMREGNFTQTLPYADNDSFNGAYSPVISVNRIFRDHGHQFLYDFHFLSMLLSAAGFIRIEKVSFGVGRDSKLLIDTADRQIESLYMEASK